MCSHVPVYFHWRFVHGFRKSTSRQHEMGPLSRQVEQDYTQSVSREFSRHTICSTPDRWFEIQSTYCLNTSGYNLIYSVYPLMISEDQLICRTCKDFGRLIIFVQFQANKNQNYKYIFYIYFIFNWNKSELYRFHTERELRKWLMHFYSSIVSFKVNSIH